MKLKAINPQDMRTIRKGHPTIRFSESGMVAISGEAVRALGLEATNQISILEDEENEGEFYITRTPKGQEGFILRTLNGNGTTKALGFNSIGLCLKITNKSSESHIYRIATEPTIVDKHNYYAILTSASK